jgi:ABC-type transport system involved in cytochrome c biogenesis permease subunit
VSVFACAVIAVGLYMAFRAPLDYQQGHAAKIMFVHVPAAWLAMAGYALVAVSSFGLLVFRHPLADVSAKAAAPIGAVFTLLCLITGSLWWPLLVMAAGMTVLFAALHLKAMRNEVLRRRVKALRTVAVEGAGGLAGQPAG